MEKTLAMLLVEKVESQVAADVAADKYWAARRAAETASAAYDEGYSTAVNSAYLATKKSP
jgi:hypothetical protein